MKSTLAIAFCLLLAGSLAAQPPGPDRSGTLHLEAVPLAEALRQVEKTYLVSFSYFEALLPEKRVTLHLRDAPLREALAQLLAGTGIAYRVAGGQIVLQAAPPAAAEFLTLRGLVRDAGTDAPLPYAAVAVPGKPLGTVANAAGEFELHLPRAMAGDSIRVSMIGYVAYRASVQHLLRQSPLRIALPPHTYALAEVVVTDSLPDLETLVGRVEANIPRNYPTAPYLATGFYRETRQLDSVGQSLVEAAVRIYDKGYDRYRLDEKVVIDQIRTSFQPRRPYGDGWDEVNLLRTFLHLNEMRHRGNLFRKGMRYSRAGTTTFQGRPVYLITVHDSIWPITAYVDRESYAVVRLEKRPPPPEANPTWRVPGSDSISFRSLHRSFVAEFREHAGKYYLSHQKIEDNMQYYNHHTGAKKEVFTLRVELLISRIDTGPVPEPAGRTMKNYSLTRQAAPYDPAFWQHYNVLKATPLEEKIRRDLERQTPLEKQYTQTATEAKKRRRHQD
jgi:hypothetical protein